LITKPIELLSVFSGESKSTHETWMAYGSDFKEYAYGPITAPYLAALAQQESSGRFLASPKWTWFRYLGWKGIFSPASSSFGLYQFTEPTFEAAKSYCFVAGKPRVKVGGQIFGRCWRSAIYQRFIPSHNIELTSAYLNLVLKNINQKIRAKLSSNKLRKIASMVHLCGKGKIGRLVRRGFNFSRMGHCGSHHVASYVNSVASLEQKFKKIASK